MAIPPKLSPLLKAYVSASNRGDADAFVACFKPDATVQDKGSEFKGTEAIKTWFEEATAKYHARLTPADVSIRGSRTMLTSLVSGNFEGSPIHLRHLLTFSNDKITALKIGD